MILIKETVFIRLSIVFGVKYNDLILKFWIGDSLAQMRIFQAYFTWEKLKRIGKRFDEFLLFNFIIKDLFGSLWLVRHNFKFHSTIQDFNSLKILIIVNNYTNLGHFKTPYMIHTTIKEIQSWGSWICCKRSWLSVTLEILPRIGQAGHELSILMSHLQSKIVKHLLLLQLEQLRMNAVLCFSTTLITQLVETPCMNLNTTLTTIVAPRLLVDRILARAACILTTPLRSQVV